MQQHGGHRRDLRKCIGFAKDAGRELAPSCGRVQNGRDNQDAHVAPEDHHRDPCGHQALVHQDEEQGAQQQLIGDGIEIRT